MATGGVWSIAAWVMAACVMAAWLIAGLRGVGTVPPAPLMGAAGTVRKVARSGVDLSGAYMPTPTPTGMPGMGMRTGSGGAVVPGAAVGSGAKGTGATFPWPPPGAAWRPAPACGTLTWFGTNGWAKKLSFIPATPCTVGLFSAINTGGGGAQTQCVLL
eukprot:CAMPEP_0182581726 /NCGR_PEP_ID=MMETSP1324-20130603/50736_1 /TAXON_ID=236786 /ORGANISM="Florenciella sp., Strain RCC1587" /LENGTH=158 /DNA_ID=CAMNT_0024798123 /DNA_START=315 /DNA_END=791 /DNA_ORIENTATION=-